MATLRPKWPPGLPDPYVVQAATDAIGGYSRPGRKHVSSGSRQSGYRICLPAIRLRARCE